MTKDFEEQLTAALESVERVVDTIGDRLLRHSLNACVVTMLNILKLNGRAK